MKSCVLTEIEMKSSNTCLGTGYRIHLLCTAGRGVTISRYRLLMSSQIVALLASRECVAMTELCCECIVKIVSRYSNGLFIVTLHC